MTAATALVGALLSAVASAGSAQAATMTTLYASPSGTGTACSVSQPCSITQAKTAVRAVNAGMTGDIVVQLADGTYRLSAPLSFTAADSGNNGHTVVWKAAPGANPIISGAQKATGWSQFDATKNIWRANVGTGFDTRQLYVDGLLATRARTQVTPRSDLTATPTGFTFTNSALSYLNTLANQSRVEVETLNSWTDRYTPVQSISNNTLTMQQPAWDNNTWGWDTVQRPDRNGPLYLENAYEFLDAAGEWYLNTTTGFLYYKPLTGQDLSTADVELPRLETLISVGGTYDAPAHDLSFTRVQFSHTSWLHPSTNEGYADQQTGGYIQGNWATRPTDAFTSCAHGCNLFESTRPNWLQMPAAVQVSAANHVTFSANKFIGLGQNGLGIGEDANANDSGVGLGAGDITVTGSDFNQIAAGGIVVGGLRADAHHPSDPRMTNKNITIKNNLIHDVAIDYRDNDAILATYTTNAVISHNEVYNLPYSAISIGYGWGVNDPGGSPDYLNRGLYNYQPIYDTPTTATGNSVVGNYVHDFMQSMNDGGCFYTLSANPSSVIDQNYCTNAPGRHGMYFDEGSRYISATSNVFNVGKYAHQNTVNNNHIGNFTLTDNWTTRDGDVADGDHGSVVSGTVIVTNGVWPSGAQTVMNAAGLEPAYQYLKYPVTAPYSTFAVNSPATFGQANGQFVITEAGTDVWGAGGQHDDQYGAVYQSQAFTNGTTVTTKVSQLDNTNPWAKAGIMVRNSIDGAGSSAGYAVLAVTPSNGVVLEYDSNGDGYLDSEKKTTGITSPVWLRLTRTGTQVSGYYSTNGTTFTQVGTAVTLSGASATEDAGVFHTSHNVNTPGTATFGSLSITTPPFAGYANIPALLDQHQSQIAITGTGADVWGGAPQHDDQYGAVYQSQAFTSGTTVTVKVDQLDNTNPWAKAGIMVRNDMTAPGSSAGYAVLAVTPSNGVLLEYDSNGDGYLDSEKKTTGITSPVWLRLTRTGTQVSGYYSTNGTTFTQVGTAVTLSGANTTEDAGVFHTSHDNKISGTANFSGLTITP